MARSRTGNRFILVICDYATRYPEAIPLELVKQCGNSRWRTKGCHSYWVNFTSRKTDTDHRLMDSLNASTKPWRPCFAKQQPMKADKSCYHTYYLCIEKYLRFELLYGRNVRGLSWKNHGKQANEAAKVLHVSQKLERMSEIVKENPSLNKSLRSGTTRLHVTESWRMAAKSWFCCLQQLTSSWLSGKGRTKSFVVSTRSTTK